MEVSFLDLRSRRIKPVFELRRTEKWSWRRKKLQQQETTLLVDATKSSKLTDLFGSEIADGEDGGSSEDRKKKERCSSRSIFPAVTNKTFCIVIHDTGDVQLEKLQNLLTAKSFQKGALAINLRNMCDHTIFDSTFFRLEVIAFLCKLNKRENLRQRKTETEGSFDTGSLRGVCCLQSEPEIVLFKFKLDIWTALRNCGKETKCRRKRGGGCLCREMKIFNLFIICCCQIFGPSLRACSGLWEMRRLHLET